MRVSVQLYAASRVGPHARAILDRPVAWMFIAVLLTFVIARFVTRSIRARSAREAAGDEGGAGLGDIHIGGVHIHHQVFGIILTLIAGLILISATPQGAALCAVAAVFGVGVGLTFDEFALWLHLKDVYWAQEGRQSIDAIFCVLVVSGLMVTEADLITGVPGSSTWWSSIAGLALVLVLSIICMLKGKLITGVVGIVLQPVVIVGSIRLAKPDSWWAHHRYASRPRRLARAERRFGEKYVHRWNRVRDFIAGAPTTATAPVPATTEIPRQPEMTPDPRAESAGRGEQQPADH